MIRPPGAIATILMKPDSSHLRKKAARVLMAHMERRSSPRVMLAWIIACTGLVGFALSLLQLHFGVRSMGLRYPVAVIGAYAVFLGLVRLWVEQERGNFESREKELMAEVDQPGITYDENPWHERPRPGVSWLDGLDLIGDVSAEGCLVGILLALAAGLVAVLVSVIGAAPALGAEVFLDVAISGLLFRRLDGAVKRHWLGAAIRRTWAHVLCAAALLSVAGICLDTMAPQADTMGRALLEIRSKPGSGR